jgi:hypothetical protein
MALPPLHVEIDHGMAQNAIAEETTQLRLEFGKQAERVLIRNGDN